MIKNTTTIAEPARARLNISRDEYALCSYIHYRVADPRQKKHGWCCDSKDEIAKFIGISRPGLFKMVAKMERIGLIEIDVATRSYRSTPAWIDAENEAKECKQSLQRPVNKVYNDRKQSLQRPVNKVYNHIKVEEDNKLELVGDEIDTPASPANNPKAPKEPWTKTIASIFDEVNEQEHTTAGISNFQKFNWKANAGRQFAALKQLKMCMQTDLIPKDGGPPTEEDYERGFRFLFECGFRYLKKIADAKGGQIFFSPAIVLNNYNSILSYAKSTRKDGTSTNSKRDAALADTLRMVMELEL